MSVSGDLSSCEIFVKNSNLTLGDNAQELITGFILMLVWGHIQELILRMQI